MIDPKEIESGLLPVLAFLRFEPKQRTEYIAALTLKFGWMNSYAWSETCKCVSETMGNGRIPTIKNFKDAYEAVKPKLPGGEVRKCSGCDGERFRFGYVRRKLDGWIYEAVSPCPKCNTLTIEDKVASAFRENFEVSTKTAHDEQRRQVHEEYLAREQARHRVAPKLEPVKLPAAPIAEVLEAALTAPAPSRHGDDWIPSV